MSDSGFASLGPSLLARKGGAKPAMRPQVAPMTDNHAETAEEQMEDLGWNDMGESGPGADVVPINAGIDSDDFGAGHGPVVRRQQRRLEERVLADAVMIGPEDREPEYDADEEEYYGDERAVDLASEPAFKQPEPVAQPAAHKPRVPAVQSGRRAAFTLRLDTDRHLKLRLAATMQGVSAQVLVTEALDRLLSEFDDLDVIATRLKRH
jgi:hypothetical protein